ncbi:MAG: glycosyltransferase family 9 protein [Endomicrobiia bacterium]
MKIVCFLPNYIGDVLMTTPAIRVLKNKLRNFEFYVAIKKELFELVDGNPNVDKIIFKDSRVNLIKNVAKTKPYCIVLFRTTFFNSLISFLLKPKFSVGTNEEFSKLFLKKTINKNLDISYRELVMKIAEKVLDYFSLNKNDIFLEIKKLDFCGYETEDVKKNVINKLKERGLVNSKLIVLSPCATRKTKMLTENQYVELINGILKNLPEGYVIVLTGSQKDEFFIGKIAIKINDKRLRNFCGIFNLKELAYFFKISSLVISPDSGPAYISEAVGTKTIIFFTSTSPYKYGPYPDNVEVLYNSINCSPCYKETCSNFLCIKEFDIEKLVEKIFFILKNEKNSD